MIACLWLFLPGDCTGSWHLGLYSMFILGSVSFLATTHTLFFFVSEFNSKGVKNFPKYYVLFWATIHQITSYWGNMASRKEYYASRDASKVYQNLSILLFSSMESVTAISVCISPWYYILKPLLKGFQEKNPRRIGHFTQH